MRKPAPQPPPPAPSGERSRGRGGSRRLAVAIVLLVLAAGLWGLWQIDLVRQNVEIAYLSFTGGMWKLRGRQATVTVPSPALGEKRQAIVYLPPGYDAPETRMRRYPVLTLLHGFPNPGGFDSWVRYGRAPQEVDRLIVEGKIPPMIVVCPDGRGKDGLYGDSEFLDPVRPGVGSRVASFTARDLTAYMDRSYRTIPNREGRILGGISTGGYGAANLALQHPDIWANVLCLSGYYEADPRHFAAPLWGPNPDAAAMRAQSPLYLLEDAGADISRWHGMFFFVGEGANEPRRERADTAAFTAALQRAGIPFALRQPPGKHSWDVWRELLRDGLVAIKGRLAADTAPADKPANKSADKYGVNHGVTDDRAPTRKP